MTQILDRVQKLPEINSSTKKIHVAHILSGNEIWGGVENYVHNLVSATDTNSIHTTVICTENGVISDKFANSNFEVHILPIKDYLDFNSMVKLASLLKEHDIDLIHAHLGLDSFAGAFAALLAKKPLVLSVHFDQPNYMSYSLIPRVGWNFAQKLKNKLVAHFLPITENVAQQLMKREAVPQEKITIVYPGIKVKPTVQSNREQIRKSLGCTETDIIAVAVGRLEDEKNFSCLIEAIAKIQNRDHLKVWLVGEGSQRSFLTEVINRLELQEQINLLGYREDVPELLSSADIFVLPSTAEAFGMAVAEAMIAGLPVVSTLVAGPKVIVQPEITGILVEPDDSEALTKALGRLIENADLRKRFGRAGHERALNLFTSESMSVKVEKVYRDLFRNLDKRRV
ncbi:glycosyltransferase [soil metagenome]